MNNLPFSVIIRSSCELRITKPPKISRFNHMSLCSNGTLLQKNMVTTIAHRRPIRSSRPRDARPPVPTRSAPRAWPRSPSGIPLESWFMLGKPSNWGYVGLLTGWCPPVISWFINPINYSYICHKP